MSTQDDSGILFEISNEQQNFRLLEIPQSLLEAIVSQNPPTLYMKSAQTPTASDGSKLSGPNAVLCTDDHTFQLRQVQSSNSVFILQPLEGHCQDNELIPASLSAIAQCTSTLELISSNAVVSVATVSRLLQKSLPAYRGVDTDTESGTDIASAREYKDQNAVLQDAPFSAAELDEAWKHLCAFEVLGYAWLPTPSALAMLWKAILSAAIVRGVKLEKSFDLKSLAEIASNDGYPRALFMAVITRLVSDAGDLRDDYVTLSRDKTVRWVGDLFLQEAGRSGISQSMFLAQWRDALPETWRKSASIDLLKVKSSQSESSKERIVFSDEIYNSMSSGTLPSANSGGKANRKWHDKFKAGRK